MEGNGKAEKFRKLAEVRVSRVLQRIHLVERLSRRSSYDYKPAQVDEMFSAIREELDRIEKKFRPSDDSQHTFRFGA
jgi:hypothetical protein